MSPTLVAALAVGSTLLSCVTMYMGSAHPFGVDPTPVILVLAAVAQLFYLSRSDAQTSRKFANHLQQPINARPHYASGMDEEAPAAPAAKSPSKQASLVPVNKDSVEFWAGASAGAAGFVAGGPIVGAVGAVAGNFLARQEDDNEVANVVRGTSETVIRFFNWASRLDAKYEVLDQAKSSLQDSYDKLKASGNSDSLVKVEKTLNDVKSNLAELDAEYDLWAKSVNFLGDAGEFFEEAINKAIKLNGEYKLTDKAIDSLKNAVDTAKSRSS